MRFPPGKDVTVGITLLGIFPLIFACGARPRTKIRQVTKMSGLDMMLNSVGDKTIGKSKMCGDTSSSDPVYMPKAKLQNTKVNQNILSEYQIAEVFKIKW